MYSNLNWDANKRAGAGQSRKKEEGNRISLFRVKPFENVTLAIHVAPFDM